MAYEVRAPEGSELRFAQIPGLGKREQENRARPVQVVGPDGEVLASVMPAVAVDAQGTPVEVDTALEGMRIVYTARHRDEDLAYPIVIDPFVQDDDRGDRFFNHWLGYETPTGWLTPARRDGTAMVIMSKLGLPYSFGYHFGIVSFRAPLSRNAQYPQDARTSSRRTLVTSSTCRRCLRAAARGCRSPRAPIP